MQPGNTGLRIIKVELETEAYSTYRYVHQHQLADVDHYAVVIWLSRPVDPYERVRLAGKDIVVDERDTMKAYVLNTTLDDVEASLLSLNEDVHVAENRAAGDKRRAEEEDVRLDALLTEINTRLAGPVS